MKSILLDPNRPSRYNESLKENLMILLSLLSVLTSTLLDIVTVFKRTKSKLAAIWQGAPQASHREMGLGIP